MEYVEFVYGESYLWLWVDLSVGTRSKCPTRIVVQQFITKEPHCIPSIQVYFGPSKFHLARQRCAASGERPLFIRSALTSGTCVRTSFYTENLNIESTSNILALGFQATALFRSFEPKPLEYEAFGLVDVQCYRMQLNETVWKRYR